MPDTVLLHRSATLRRARHFNRTASDTANWLRKPRKKKFSAVPLIGAVVALRFSPDCLTRERQEFKEEGHSFNPRTAREQCLAAYGQTAGVPFFFAPAAGAVTFPPSADGESPLAESQRKTPSPLWQTFLFQAGACPNDSRSHLLLQHSAGAAQFGCCYADEKVPDGICCVKNLPRAERSWQQNLILFHCPLDGVWFILPFTACAPGSFRCKSVRN